MSYLCLENRATRKGGNDREPTMIRNGYPEGWDEDRVQRILEHYENQSGEEAVSEDEAAYEDRTQTVMEVPVDLVPAVRELIARHKRTGTS